MSEKLSAFARVKNTPSDNSDSNGGGIDQSEGGYKGISTDNDDDDDDDDLGAIKYDNVQPIELDFGFNNQNNNSENIVNNNRNSIGTIPTPPNIFTPQMSRSQSQTNNNNLRSSIPILSTSKFKMDDENVIFGDNYVIFGLKVNEYIIIKGQCKLMIQRGSIFIDSVQLHSDRHKELKIISSSLNSLTMISSTQVTDSDLTKDLKNFENEHLFNSNYKSVIKLSNWCTGLEKIGDLCPQLKNILPNESSNLDLINNEQEFFEYSFYPILSQQYLQYSQNSSVPAQSSGLYIPKIWKQKIKEIIDDFKQNDILKDDKNSNLKLLILGSKNCGKSTFSRFLLNNLILSSSPSLSSVRSEVCVLDIDPGQPEYSVPDSISLVKISEPIFGLNYNVNEMNTNSNSKNENTTESTEEYQILKQFFVGFNSPQREPLRYFNYIRSLLNEYHAKYSHLPLIINTPGWIKGFGIEIIKSLNDLIIPSHLIYLSHENSSSSSYLLNLLKYDKLINIQPIYLNDSNLVKYSPSQIRKFKLLSYFHKINKQNDLEYMFDPLLKKSPYKVSFHDTCDITTLLNFNAPILGVAILDSYNISHEDLNLCIDGQVVGIASINVNELQALLLSNPSSQQQGHQLIRSHHNFPNLISNTIIKSTNSIKFHGLGLVHSVNNLKKYINLYTPISTELLSNLNSNQESLILIKGRSDTPIEEIVPKFLINDFANKTFKNSNSELIQNNIPYTSFESNTGAGGKVLNIRRNIMRRGGNN
ncbi:hypothetical protein B5S33_g2702 [[Candida] boidinii]|nr:hypothetical protein B5S30_g2517 [[Candida] boidinii]OWB84065.1 hypothetical protein B5S33_g2702 [[Candida] boidinii]